VAELLRATKDLCADDARTSNPVLYSIAFCRLVVTNPLRQLKLIRSGATLRRTRRREAPKNEEARSADLKIDGSKNEEARSDDIKIEEEARSAVEHSRELQTYNNLNGPSMSEELPEEFGKEIEMIKDGNRQHRGTAYSLFNDQERFKMSAMT
jgi:hypothetical protein